MCGIFRVAFISNEKKIYRLCVYRNAIITLVIQWQQGKKTCASSECIKAERLKMPKYFKRISVSLLYIYIYRYDLDLNGIFGMLVQTGKCSANAHSFPHFIIINRYFVLAVWHWQQIQFTYNAQKRRKANCRMLKANNHLFVRLVKYFFSVDISMLAEYSVCFHLFSADCFNLFVFFVVVVLFLVLSVFTFTLTHTHNLDWLVFFGDVPPIWKR